MEVLTKCLTKPFKNTTQQSQLNRNFRQKSKQEAFLINDVTDSDHGESREKLKLKHTSCEVSRKKDENQHTRFSMFN